MKKLLTLLAAFSIVLALQAESPEKISYQAIIRNTKGELVKNQSIGMKISIYFYNKTMPVTSYAETHTPTTDENGLVSIEIGTGKVVTGVFADINWAVRAYYLKIEIDPGGRTSYSITSDTQILSVPYALHAKTATEIADNSVNSSKITDGSIIASDLADNSVTINKLPDGATAKSFLRGDGKWAKTSADISFYSVDCYAFFPLDLSIEFEDVTMRGRCISKPTGTWRDKLCASINLPDGHRITKMTVYFVDNSEMKNLKVTLYNRSLVNGGIFEIANFQTTGYYEFLRNSSMALDYIIDNKQWTYIILVDAPWGEGVFNILSVIFELEKIYQ